MPLPRFAAPLLAAVLTLTACQQVPIATGPPAPGDGSSVESQLDSLQVAKAGSMKGYTREKFPHWRSTGENCDVRDSVLKRDGTKVKLSGCNVVAGTWKSIYDGKVLDSPTKVDIDHMVPLANAWRSGAAAWTTDKRSDFANDLDDPQLVAVSAGSNRSKGDQDPSTWKPPAKASWCEYAEDWIAVKAHWKLTVTTAEKSALSDMLGACT
ncbi:HNH endonuclease [Actinoplanes sp. TBRC 11911]|uniref:HNH endonuclease family protein n=1 Tax=Actinoplanes sp. TBRC 11911 TaxID=2729386 RepID=UPI00145F9951|nr:HNH endonuclease family protein [Actinoplanes sp. TBRC 11911]NMO52228.1 HNH endonuclease [Actinoplanes sp. TBRC 11911]